MDYSVEQEFKKVWKALKCKADCGSGGGGTPSLPLNSIQYNNGGAFQGDTLFTRDFTTQETNILANDGTFEFGIKILPEIKPSFSASVLKLSTSAKADVFAGVNDAGMSYSPDGNLMYKAFVQDGAMSFVEENDVYFHNYLVLDKTNNVYKIGDIDTSNLGTNIIIDDNTQIVTITNVPSYADDAAATGAGLTTGQLYSTTTGGSTFLKIVP